MIVGHIFIVDYGGKQKLWMSNILIMHQYQGFKNLVYMLIEIWHTFIQYLSVSFSLDVEPTKNLCFSKV